MSEIRKEFQLKLQGERVKGSFVNVTNFQSCLRPNFTDFLFAPWRLTAEIAIDFTFSNGDFNKPESLHYTEGGLSVYEEVIKEVGSVLDNYVLDPIRAYGFGGIPGYDSGYQV